MKNLKIKMLSLGVLSTIIISSTPVFAATSTTSASKSENKIINAISKDKKATISDKKTLLGYSSYDTRTIQQVLDDGDVVKYGDYGLAVKTVQHYLNGCGYSVNEDGKFGTSTKNAVMRFQGNQGGYLDVDGIVGKDTWRYLVARQD